MFNAYTTDGEVVVVQQDLRDGRLIIVEPGQMRGQPVAIVNDNDPNRILVSRDLVYRSPRGAGSGGDDPRRDDRRPYDPRPDDRRPDDPRPDEHR